MMLELDWRIENEHVVLAPSDTTGSIERRIRHHEDRIRALRAELAAARRRGR